MSPGGSQRLNAADLDGDGSEVRKTIERVRGDNNRAWIQTLNFSARSGTKMRRQIRKCHKLRQNQFFAEQPTDNKAIFSRCSHSECDRPMEKTKNTLQGQLRTGGQRSKRHIGDVRSDCDS